MSIILTAFCCWKYCHKSTEIKRVENLRAQNLSTEMKAGWNFGSRDNFEAKKRVF